MKLFSNKYIKHYILAIAAVIVTFALLSEFLAWLLYKVFSFLLLILFLLMVLSILAIC